ncbi:MAG: hypothetical protein R3E11_00580 [Sphingobium sp.]|nr:hypothetical protein [Sphingobium sp.]MCP5400044.1 hypothetical protein [Sphingomonas sp.]
MLNIRKILIAFALCNASTSPAKEPLPQYPSLDAKELGHIHNIVALAQQPGFDTMKEGPRGAFDQYQFQIAWMYYALAVAQTQQLPAYRELYKKTSDRLIEKMMEPDVWQFWLTVIEKPRFSKYLDKSTDWRDPVRSKNIMYSGHLLQMVGLYQRLYADDKYTHAGSIKFEIPGEGGFRHEYSFKSLAENIRQQFIDSELEGIECEPNFVFAECNQHPILGLLDYDMIYGTNLADIRSGFWEEAEKIGFLNHQTSRFAGPHLKHENITGKMTTAWNDGWTGLTLHAWNPDAVDKLYPVQRDAEFPKLINQDPAVWSVRWSKASVSTDFGFLTAYAAEVGDDATKSVLLDYADTHFHPVWTKGRLYYPRHDVDTDTAPVQITGQESVGPFPAPSPAPLKPEQFGDHLVGPLTGNALLAFARLNPGDGLWNTYNRLDVTYAQNDLQLVEVDYPSVDVTQAYYDRTLGRLAITLAPGPHADTGPTRFAITNIDSTKLYSVSVDGHMVAQGKGQSLVSRDPAMTLNWSEPNSLIFKMPIGSGRQIIVDQLVR